MVDCQLGDPRGSPILSGATTGKLKRTFDIAFLTGQTEAPRKEDKKPPAGHHLGLDLALSVILFLLTWCLIVYCRTIRASGTEGPTANQKGGGRGPTISSLLSWYKEREGGLKLPSSPSLPPALPPPVPADLAPLPPPSPLFILASLASTPTAKVGAVIEV